MNNNHPNEVWDKGFIVTMATVKSVVDQYAEGKIQLELPHGKGRHNIRYAGADSTKPYTASTIGKFLGWLEPDGSALLKTFDAVNALQFVEEGMIDISAFAGISESQAYKIVAKLKSQAKKCDTVDSPNPVYTKKDWPPIAPATNHGKETWRVDTRLMTNGERKGERKFFNSKEEAEGYAEWTRANGDKQKDTISLSVEAAKKIHHTLISLAQSCLELAKLVDV